MEHVPEPASLEPMEVPTLRRPGGTSSLRVRLRALYRLLCNRDAPWLPRVVAILSLAYVVVPTDVIPDGVALLGWMDDLGIMGALLAYLTASAARYEHSTHGTSAGL